MSSPSLRQRIVAVAAALEVTPAQLVALVLVASLACAGTVWLWLAARPDGIVPPVAVVTPGAPTAPAGAPTDPATPDPGGQGVVVHVSGAVRSAGVHELPAGGRVVDAIDAAGGARRNAATASLNLARPLRDGEQIHVPRPGEIAAHATSAAADGAVVAGEVPADQGVVDLNRASAAELETLPGVGPVRRPRCGPGACGTAQPLAPWSRSCC
jgi:competence protein ComEA